MIKFYERVGYENRRPSPFSWRIRYALAHKQLDAEVIPVRFADVALITEISGQRFVPVIDHDGTRVADSWEIACYLERMFPERASLFGGEHAMAQTLFISRWTDETLHPLIRELLMPDFIYCLDAADRPYYRQSREAMFGHTLEDCVHNHAEYSERLRQALTPLRRTLETQPFLGGASSTYADYVVFAAFQWARLGCPRPLLGDDEVVLNRWVSDMRSLFQGLAEQFPGYPGAINLT